MNQSFSLLPKRDLDIIEWLGDQSNKSKAIREALRYYIKRADGGTVRQEIKLLEELSKDMAELNERINEAIITSASRDTQLAIKEGNEIPEEVKQNLRNLAK